MRLLELISELPEIESSGLPDLEVNGLTADSREVKPGDLFVAIRGVSVDGHQYLEEAIRRGAASAMGELPDPGLGIPYLRVSNSRYSLALLAAAWHGYPARRMVMIGVTGTDGKTTTANLLHSILHDAGLAVGMISTVNALIGAEEVDTGLHVTTPDPMDLQAYLSRMVARGLRYCILEATSHGLAQHRVAGCDFDLGLVTNITHEHLDFHGTYEAYREAKGMLIAGLSESAEKSFAPAKMAILNRDDRSYAYLRELAMVKQASYGFDQSATIAATEVRSGPKGIAFIAKSESHTQSIRSPLLGKYNVSNVLAAYAAAVEGLAIDPSDAAESVAAFSGVTGRMEFIDLGQPFDAVVDFAHTPNALRQTLLTARDLTKGKVIAIFGSAGLRDRAKRRMMAEISAELADLSVLTAEDPRTEPLEAILAEMAEGARSKGGEEGITFWRVPDRGEAIREGVRLAAPGDIVLVCGKGHEQSMCFGEIEHPWDDRVALRAALAELLETEGPEMPDLPTSR